MAQSLSRKPEELAGTEISGRIPAAAIAVEQSVAGLSTLVIGGSSGIGRAMAEGLQSLGAKVAIAARTPAKVEMAVATLRTGDPSAAGFVADVTNDEGLASLVRTVEAERPPLDLLINCQGATAIGPAEDIAAADYDRIMSTNVRSVFFASIRFGEAMLRRQSGSIINIASVAAHRGFPQAAVYAASKHAVVGLTQTLAAEWAARGVRVNAISPGFFMTGLNRTRMSDARKREAIHRTPMGRFGEVEELIGAAAFLASPCARFVTGSVISVDGGYLASGI